MAWQTTYIKVLRILIDDLEPDVTYTDSRLEDLIVLAASQVNYEIELGTTYTIVIAPPSISPDPTSDHTLMNLATLKAACILDRSAMRKAMTGVGGSLEARCGPAVLKLGNRDAGFKLLLEQGFCAAYDEAIKQAAFGNLAYAQGILSPFVNELFNPGKTISTIDYRTHYKGY